MLATSQPVVDVVGVWQHAGSTADLDALRLCVVSKDSHGSLRRSHKVKQDVDRRRFTRPVGAEKPENLTLLDREVEIVDGDDIAKAFREPVDLDRRHVFPPDSRIRV